MPERVQPPKIADHPLVKAFDKAYTLASNTSNFAVGGILTPKQMEQGNIMLYIKGQDEHATVYPVPLDDISAQALYDSGSISPHGRGTETVIDTSYRDAHEVKPPNFSINVDFLTTSGLLGDIATAIGSGNLSAEFNKLNMYAKGGFFKSHKDTPLGERHIGSIVMCLPSHFEGGELVVMNQETKVTFDFAADFAKSPNCISWAFLYSDCEHEVLPVTNGVRIALAYDVYVLPAQSHGVQNDSRAGASGFLPQGGLVGIGLQHTYPTDVFTNNRSFHAENLVAMLKGADQAVYASVKRSGIDWEFNGIFREECCYYDAIKPGEAYSESYEVDELLRTPKFFLLEGECCEGGYRAMGAEPTNNVHWVSLPRHFTIKNAYVAYGNEMDHTYAAIAIVIELPPIDGSVAGPSQLAKNQDKTSKLFKTQWGY